MAARTYESDLKVVMRAEPALAGTPEPQPA
jgi:hypothetical protein